MAQHRIFTATELVPLLHERGIDLSASQVHRLVSGTPERLSLQVMAALCDILSCTPADLVAPTPPTNSTSAGSWPSAAAAVTASTRLAPGATDTSAGPARTAPSGREAPAPDAARTEPFPDSAPVMGQRSAPPAPASRRPSTAHAAASRACSWAVGSANAARSPTASPRYSTTARAVSDPRWSRCSTCW
ncbi:MULTISPECIES: helix-turn-helix domain-containing protein [Streptomyces]|uniref:helix-turn-helix domain-containing protein n=1 Tax=Streptomyces lycopersici TaxID=2974589 RepID=UPI0021D0A78A|nr:helix-turn-helix domain-containing protein [Streptomyces sp. NEAU-383]